MGRSMSQGVADGLQDMRSRQAESDAFNSRLEANSAAQAARRAERKVEELTAKLYTESGTLYATRSLLASLRKICLENLTEEDLESKRKVWLEGARGWINEHATDAQKLQIRQACTSVSSVRWPDLYDLVPPPKPSVTDLGHFKLER